MACFVGVRGIFVIIGGGMSVSGGAAAYSVTGLSNVSFWTNLGPSGDIVAGQAANSRGLITIGQTFGLDEDDVDYTATHITLRQQGKVVAYARLFDDYSDEKTYEQAISNQTPPRVICVGRMLTTERGQGFARILMNHIITEARRQGADILRLHAQKQAVPFYRHFRFHTVGSTFVEADLPHIIMERRLTRPRAK